MEGGVVVGIREMFAEYSGEDVDWFQMAFYFEQQHRDKLERQRRYAATHKGIRTAREWRARQPKAIRLTDEQRKLLALARKARWIAKDPQHARAIRLAAQKRWRAKNQERLRAEDRARKRAERMAA